MNQAYLIGCTDNYLNLTANIYYGLKRNVFKGHFKIKSDSGLVKVAEIKRQTHVQVVRSLEERADLADDEVVNLGEKVKAVLLDGCSTMLVYKDEKERSRKSVWKTCTKHQLRQF